MFFVVCDGWFGLLLLLGVYCFDVVLCVLYGVVMCMMMFVLDLCVLVVNLGFSL